ncbi:MAG TPA: hypothetical protein VGP07_08625 [Polyangia bacterium]|jgi:hypothetical protein
MRAFAILLAVCAIPAVACVKEGQTSVERASRELSCPQSQLTTVNRTDIDDNVFDVKGCGRSARYMCFHPNQSGYYCAREPAPDPAEEAARPEVPVTAPPSKPRAIPR